MEEIDDVRVTLQEESENRFVANDGFPMYECLANTLMRLLSRRPVQGNDYGNGTSDDTDPFPGIENYTSPENIQNSVVDLLSKHSTQFQSVLVLLVDDVAIEALQNDPSGNKDHEKQLKDFYQKVISDCRNGRYVTMYMSSEKAFHKIESNDISAPKPKTTGLVGMYLKILEDTLAITIAVPVELRRLPAASKSRLCYTVSREIVLECCTLFIKQCLIRTEDYNRMTAHRATRVEFAMLVKNTDAAFNILCQVLIKRRERTILTPYLYNWSIFVRRCDFLAKYDALVVLDNAIYKRNISVSAFVNSCKTGGQELDERRKRITTTVIASSSVGIASGGMVIAGILLAPFSFGASLGLSIAGGVIGAGSGVAAGTARTVEAVKQNTKLKDIRAEQANIQQKEERVATALEKTGQRFQTSIEKTNTADEEGPGISRRGFLAFGSAFRASHSVAGIALAAVKFGTTAAAVSASVLGPLSLVFDVAFLAEAAHNKAKGDKTNAGELLQRHAETVDMKCKIFNGMLRGNCEEQGRLLAWT